MSMRNVRRGGGRRRGRCAIAAQHRETMTSAVVGGERLGEHIIVVKANVQLSATCM